MLVRSAGGGLEAFWCKIAQNHCFYYQICIISCFGALGGQFSANVPAQNHCFSKQFAPRVAQSRCFYKRFALRIAQNRCFLQSNANYFTLWCLKGQISIKVAAQSHCFYKHLHHWPLRTAGFSSKSLCESLGTVVFTIQFQHFWPQEWALAPNLLLQKNVQACVNTMQNNNRGLA